MYLNSGIHNRVRICVSAQYRVDRMLSTTYKNDPTWSEHNKGNNKKFVDNARIRVAGGKGGNGCISFEMFSDSWRRPSGGHGGNGGNVILIADSKISSLNLGVHHFNASPGSNGGGKNLRGRTGKDMVIRVPCGTVIRKIVRRGEEEYSANEVLGREYDMDHDDDENDDVEVDDDDDVEVDYEEEDEADNSNEHEHREELLAEHDQEESLADKDEVRSTGRGRKRRSKLRKIVVSPAAEEEEEEEEGDDEVDKEALKGNATEEDNDDYHQNDEEYFEENEDDEFEEVDVADLIKDGDQYIAARGGRPGLGNGMLASSKAKSSTLHHRSAGHVGEDAFLHLELKIIAQVISLFYLTLLFKKCLHVNYFVAPRCLFLALTLFVLPCKTRYHSRWD
jgi:GTPase involved in cell partitioning and DNA repair